MARRPKRTTPPRAPRATAGLSSSAGAAPPARAEQAWLSAGANRPPQRPPGPGARWLLALAVVLEAGWLVFLGVLARGAWLTGIVHRGS
ncbi:MAG: hypothetical protein ABSF26_01805 [Thermoguttaceae bacterium]